MAFGDWMKRLFGRGGEKAPPLPSPLEQMADASTRAVEDAEVHFADEGTWVETPQSSNVHSFSYFFDDLLGGELRVRYKHRPGWPVMCEYTYEDVPNETFHGFIEAKLTSPGHFSWTDIRNDWGFHYNYRRLWGK